MHKDDTNDEQDSNDGEFLTTDNHSKAPADEILSPTVSDIDRTHQKKRSRHRHHHRHRKHSKSNKHTIIPHHHSTKKRYLYR